MPSQRYIPSLSLPVPDPVPVGGLGESAVLVSLAEDSQGDEWVVLTKRTTLVETHKGQVSFPGGYWSQGDRSLLETALRETEEEIGLRRHDVSVLGFLDPVITRGAVRILPVVGKFRLPYPFQLSQGEVDRILMLPMTRLATERLVTREIDLGGRTIPSPAIEIEGEIVWGATARILEQLIKKF